MQFVFLKNKLPDILSKPEHLDLPSTIIKRLGPYLMAALFNEKLETSIQVQNYIAKNIDKSVFMSQLQQESHSKNWRVNLKKSNESLALAVIGNNYNLADQHFGNIMNNKEIVLSEALTLAYSLVIQRTMQWPAFSCEAQVIQKLIHILHGQKLEGQKININTLYQKQFLSDLGQFFPEFMAHSQGKIYATELPIDYFVGELQGDYKDFYFEQNQLIDLKFNNQVYSFQFVEEFEHQPIKALLWRYVKLKKIKDIYPNMKVIWCERNVQKAEILAAIGV